MVAERTEAPPILAEDLLLLLFQPESATRDTGIVAGENTLSYVLAGAVLADLGLGGHVRTMPGQGESTRVEVVAHRPPADDILRSAWDRLAGKPRGLQAALAAIGPALHVPLLDRLIERGDIRCTFRTARDFLPVEVLEEGGSGRRARLLADVRGNGEPRPRLAVLAALLSGSGTLPQFGPGVPWADSIIARAKRLEQESWGAEAASDDAIVRTVLSTISAREGVPERG